MLKFDPLRYDDGKLGDFLSKTMRKGSFGVHTVGNVSLWLERQVRVYSVTEICWPWSASGLASASLLAGTPVPSDRLRARPPRSTSSACFTVCNVEG